MVTVMYEKEKGLRDKYERPDGCSISVTKVVSIPINILYSFWNDDHKLSRWLVPDGVRKYLI